MTAERDPAGLEAVVLAHLDDAYNLARWLMRSAPEAEKVVQDAIVRAFECFGTFRGGNARAWTLQIVRTAAYAALRHRDDGTVILPPDGDDLPEGDAQSAAYIDPEAALARAQEREQFEALIEELPVAFRECLVLRELVDCSYEEIAKITDVPVGTVMSRLWRARRMLVRRAAERGR